MIDSGISVITPAYNCSKTIEDTYNSLLSQTYKLWEWIVVEDHSVDDSFAFIAKMVKGDSRVKLLRTKKNSGSAAARNVGLHNASGKYITFLDSDDFLDSNYLEEQLKFIKLNGPIVSSGYRRMTSKSVTEFIVPDLMSYRTILKGNPISCLTTMYDRDIIGNVFFPENFKYCEDYIFWLNILKKGYIVKGNKKILATYRITGTSKSSNKFKLIKHQYLVYRKSQNINCFLSCYYTIKWAFYGLKKYKNVR